MRVIRALGVALLSAIVAAGTAYFLVVRPKVRSWGVDPAEAELPIPGDELIPEPSHTETRGITIDAPPAKVWPWLVQMGYERGGWYSYDSLDTRRPVADRILPEFQDLKAGDILPYGPGSGFRVETVEPERALVLYMDTELARSQAEVAVAEGKLPAAMTETSYPEMSASWSFLLQPEEGGAKTRLIERFRAVTPGAGPAQFVLSELMGTGIVLMGRKQMLGIKERVEREAQPVLDAESTLVSA